jgi:crotonobetainyl-CoA:carnitine CoA-transferase CaiB-like acyl-CoA transferase
MMKHAFDKIKVVELGGYIVGSFCASLLADLGAEVIKIESLQGDGLRGLLGAFQGWNRGKRGLAADLSSEEGKAILHQLVEQSDVLVQNLRPMVSERWGADYATLSRLNPQLIYCSMPGYGQSGPYMEKPAFDPLLQARSGAMAAQGGPGKPPVYYVVAICDYAGAMLGAYGVALALYQRARTGKGQHLHSPLLNAAIAVQSGEFVAYPGKPEPPRMDSWGTDATYRLYNTQDGWIFLGCNDDSSWPTLCRALGKEELIGDTRFDSTTRRQENASQLALILEAVFAGDSRQHWLDRLEEAGIPCAPVQQARELFAYPQLLQNDLIAEHDSMNLGKLKQMGMVVKLSETPGKLWRAAPGLGQHTGEILSELGYSAEKVEELRVKRIIA